MIRRLKRKFILINMSLVSLVLIVVIGTICFSSFRRMQDESYDAMRHALSRDIDAAQPLPKIGGGLPGKAVRMTPIFDVSIDRYGNIMSVKREIVEVSDDVAAEAAGRALASGKTSGSLFDLKLRYLIQNTQTGARIVFADVSSGLDSLAGLVTTLLLAGLGALAAFFLISLFLSRWALRPVERAWEQQRQFVADASHELKTPLTVILANMGILLSHKNDTIEKQLKWVEYTGAEADRMKKLVDDLLFLAKADAAAAPRERSKLNFSDIVLSCLLSFEPVAFELGVTLESAITPCLCLNGDEGQLRQLVVILLDNSCKYAGANGTAAVSLKHVSENVVLSVYNTGEAIPKEQLGHIFERFYRVDASRARGCGGYGLGLAIAKTIVGNHNGRIWAESDEKTGTSFTVEFPVRN